MITPQTLKGFRDFLPAEARKRQYVISTLKKVFESFGFEPLETPVLEYEEILAGKYGDEGEQLMYRFEDNGKRRVAMRYDQTVPTARVVAQYQNELPIPFKRYQIQPVWRAENTQKGRYREFLQCDADIVGIKSSMADAEIIATAARGLEVLGFTNFKILINDRNIFKSLSNTTEEKKYFKVSFDIPSEKIIVVIRTIDKLKKIGPSGVIAELAQNGFTETQAEEILEKLVNTQKTDYLEELFVFLQELGLTSETAIFEPTLARGLNYYTGVIFEIEVEGYTVGSVCGGGRYDNLIGMFAGKQIPATGFAYGFDRIMEAMETLNLFPANVAESSTKVLVTVFSEELKQKSLDICSRLRSNSINTEVYLGEIKNKNPLEKQLKYADQKKIPYVIVIGPEEAEKDQVTLKNMKTREQKQIPLDQLTDELIKN